MLNLLIESGPDPLTIDNPALIANELSNRSAWP